MVGIVNKGKLSRNLDRMWTLDFLGQAELDEAELSYVLSVSKRRRTEQG